MPRLGRQINHSQEVRVEGIRACFSSDGIYRYALYIPYHRQTSCTRTAGVILKNPSSADARRADTTVRKVEEYVFQHLSSVGQLTILNLFGYRATDTRDVNSKISNDGIESAIGDQNDDFIRSTIHNCDKIVVAWGSRSRINEKAYDRRIQQIARLLYPYRTKLFHVGQLTNKKHPRHGQIWSYDHEMIQLPDCWCWWP